MNRYRGKALAAKAALQASPDLVLRSQIETAANDDGLTLAQHLVDLVRAIESDHMPLAQMALADLKRYLNGDVG